MEQNQDSKPTSILATSFYGQQDVVLQNQYGTKLGVRGSLETEGWCLDNSHEHYANPPSITFPFLGERSQKFCKALKPFFLSF